MANLLSSKKSTLFIPVALLTLAGLSFAQERDNEDPEHGAGHEHHEGATDGHDHVAHAHEDHGNEHGEENDEHEDHVDHHVDHGEHKHEEHAHGTDGSIGGFLFPSMVVFGTMGAFEPGSNPEDFATTEHDPLNEAGITAVEFDLGININDLITGLVAGFVYQDPNHQWRGEFEEAYLHYQVNPNFAFGGGQFLNAFGFQNSRHTHTWEFINQNLSQSRMLNEGHLTTQGGEFLIHTPGNSGLLTLGGGGVRAHAHEEEEEEHVEGEFDAHDASLDQHVFTGDYRFALPNISDSVMSLSYATGANSSGGKSQVFGLGLQKIWNPVELDPISLTSGVGAGSFMFRGEVLRRKATVMDEDGDSIRFLDTGVNANIHYGISDQMTLSLRHDWVSEIEGAHGGADFHRTSPAVSYFLDPQRRALIRFQYDHVRSREIGSEHVAWLQFRVYFGGSNHDH